MLRKAILAGILVLVMVMVTGPAMAGSKPTAPTPAPKATTSVQHTVGVDIGPVSVTRSCEIKSPSKCSTSVAISGAGFTGSVSTNGDVCGGGTVRGGAAVYGKGSAVGCYNVANGSQSVKAGGSVGIGLGLDAVSAGVTTGATVTKRYSK